MSYFCCHCVKFATILLPFFEHCTNCAIILRPLSRDHFCENLASLLFHSSARERLQMKPCFLCTATCYQLCVGLGLMNSCYTLLFRPFGLKHSFFSLDKGCPSPLPITIVQNSENSSCYGQVFAVQKPNQYTGV